MLTQYLRTLIKQLSPQSSIEDKAATTFQELIAELKRRGGITGEYKILDNFLHFFSKTIAEIMIPRSDISDIKSDASLSEISALINRTNHTRTLVYKGERENIVGFIHIKDLYRIVTGDHKLVMKELLRSPLSLPSSMRLLDALAAMQKEHIHIALVIDEYGSVDGIITIEDIIETLFGPIEDEHDQEEAKYERLDESTIVTDARVKIEDIENIIGKTIKNDGEECETIGGLVLARSGRIVVAGTKVKLTPEIEAEVIEANPRTIKQIKLFILDK